MSGRWSRSTSSSCPQSRFSCCASWSSCGTTAAWVAQQLREAFPFDEAPRYLIRDRDGIYGEEVHRCLKGLGVEEVVTAPRSPWQNPFVERLIGSLRRECLDYVIVWDERHLRRILQSYLAYYNSQRRHSSLGYVSPAEYEQAE